MLRFCRHIHWILLFQVQCSVSYIEKGAKVGYGKEGHMPGGSYMYI